MTFEFSEEGPPCFCVSKSHVAMHLNQLGGHCQFVTALTFRQSKKFHVMPNAFCLDF